MAKYRKKPVVIEAVQWFRNGDHPDDNCVLVRAAAATDKFTGDIRDNSGAFVPDSEGHPFLCEGAVVRYFRRPDIPGNSTCVSSIPCSSTMHQHGWIDTPEGGHTVCPGDWIITGVKGERYPCKPDIFDATYEKVEDGE
jgi:hypothetical protein